MSKKSDLTYSLIEDSERISIEKQFRVGVTDHLFETLSACHTDSKAAIQLQFFPRREELIHLPEESRDPIGDDVHSPVKGIVHRYPDRCLLTPLLVCPAYCRFCFRREKVGKKNQSLSSEELEQALHYIEQHVELSEVIITGGEPLMLRASTLHKLMRRLDKMEHIDVVRFHTRSLILDPDLMTDDLIQALNISKAVYVVLHANHPAELTPKTLLVVDKLINQGIPMLSQTVLLKGINDQLDILSELMKQLVKNRIKPYYLHHGDLAQGTSHFRVSIAEGQALMKGLRGKISGLCQPTYVLDIPGGYGKMPIQASYLEQPEGSEKTYVVEDYLGTRHLYREGVER